MPRPRFHLRTLMIAVPVAGVILALSIRAAALIGSGREALELVVLLSIAWVPAVFVFLPPKVAGWLFMLAISASIYQAAHGDLSSRLVTFWLTFAFGIGYVATKALHLPGRDRGRDTRPEADSHADV